MNRFAYLTTGLAVKALAGISRAKIYFHGKENIPKGSIIFVVNHFTRIETFFLPSHLYYITNHPVWSLADYTLFQGAFGKYLSNIGALSTKNPDRDRLIVKSLLTGEANWIIFPEGSMVKSKKIIEKGKFIVSSARGKHPPHTGAATLALRSEFYRQRIFALSKSNLDEAKRIVELFGIDSIDSIANQSAYIVPLNITYYPMRAKENALSHLASHLFEDIPEEMRERMQEEIMTEGTMLLSGADVDIRFGKATKIEPFICNESICKDIESKKEINFDDHISSKKVMQKKALKIMQKYMSAIYSMTTINHDHLFASILRMMPSNIIDETELRERVFWLTTQLEKMGLYLHTSLKSDQTHLLTDDRFKKFQDFISVTLEKGIVKRDKKNENKFIKDKSKLSSAFSFHRVRLDNPIEVIANEVEPMTILQRRVKSTARMPGFWLKRKITNYLLKHELETYQKDYEKFYVEAESKSKQVGMPFFIKGRTKKTGVLLIHGYMAAPLELKELADYLGKKGFFVYVPRLKGHGTSPQDLAQIKWEQWVESVDAGYAILKNSCKEVVIGGFSTGAGLALHLVARVKDVRGLFAVCPPLRLQDFSAKFVPILDTWNRFLDKARLLAQFGKKASISKEGSNIMDILKEGSGQKKFLENNPENPHISYLKNPISGLRELERLMGAVEEKLPQITVPALVVQSLGDPVVDYRGSRKIFKNLASEDKQYTSFNFNRHAILMGKGSERVHRLIYNFIEYLKA